MQQMTRDQLVALLDDIRDRVASGDSFEGRLQYLLGTDASRPFEVAALYRIDNLLGQGSTRIIGLDLEPMTGSLVACHDCRDENGPFSREFGPLLCEGCVEKASKK
ncbi:hypothetical protein J7E97_07875 [Streptomyces sp. ISL-66]|uniref:hypothetical protein n=1 Tax=Streptomyces sp. ISL-66 TaxID=2819186 RepID=UPI001BEAC62C|nr:hypothetical protein [Streptomyces sp. ISL-66]MBT2467791.1 hypothetical protein [Streptomyces sp. ISL-66]